MILRGVPLLVFFALRKWEIILYSLNFFYGNLYVGGLITYHEVETPSGSPRQRTIDISLTTFRGRITHYYPLRGISSLPPHPQLPSPARGS